MALLLDRHVLIWIKCSSSPMGYDQVHPSIWNFHRGYTNVFNAEYKKMKRYLFYGY